MHCTVGPTGKGEASVTDCVAGTPSGHYSFGDIVELSALVPADHFNKGWRFSRWQDSTGGGGRINCDDTGGAGRPPATNCRFQIFDNLAVDLHFDDVEGPQDTTIGAGGPAPVTNATSAAFTFNSPSEPNDLRRPDRERAVHLLRAGQGPDRQRGLDPGLPHVDGRHGRAVREHHRVPGQREHHQQPHRRLTVGAGESGATVVCTLDAASVPCGPSFGNLSEGQHTFTARSTDQAGNTGPTATRTWTVDTVAPTASITGEPAHGARSATARRSSPSRPTRTATPSSARSTWPPSGPARP